jgi:DNA-binding CsgD family transcriptional regulator
LRHLDETSFRDTRCTEFIGEKIAVYQSKAGQAKNASVDDADNFLGAATPSDVMNNAESGAFQDEADAKPGERDEARSSNSGLRPFHGQVPPHEDHAATPRDVLIALTYGLELVRNGAMLVASEGRPHLANGAALAILQKRDGLSIGVTGLVADRASDTRLLLKLLQEAITMPQMGEPQGSPMTLPRNKARNALIVRVVPGPGLNCWPGTNQRAALLTMYDEDIDVEVDETVLSKLYGLTRGEAALAAILIKGKSIEEAAEQLLISPHTARTHLKRIFMKTDTHRQSELVVRIFSSVL